VIGPQHGKENGNAFLLRNILIYWKDIIVGRYVAPWEFLFFLFIMKYFGGDE